MNLIKLLISIIVLFSIITTSRAAMHKCTNSNGQVKYQDKPCDLKKEKAETIKTKEYKSPIKNPTSKQKKLLTYYTSTENHKTIVNACNDSGLTQAFNRFKEINENNIKQGKEIYTRGFVGLSTSELSSIMKKAQSKARIQFAKASAQEKSRTCGSYEAKLRVGTAASRKIKNGDYADDYGYEEGDLDPEGND